MDEDAQKLNKLEEELQGVGTQPVNPIVQPQANIPPTPAQPSPLQPTPTPTPAPPPEKGKSKAILWLGVAFLLLALVGIGVYYFTSRKTTPTPTPEPVATQAPTPTPDPTANWQTYVNTQYGYSVKYPEDGTLFEVGETTITPAEGWQAAGIRVDPLEIRILSYVNKDGLSSQEYAEENAPKFTLTNKKTMTVGGKSAFQYDYVEPRGEKQFPTRRTTVVNNNYVIELSASDLSGEANFSVYDLMVSTFKFTEATSSATPTSSPSATISP